jgi:hypothetical protein
MEEPMSKLEVPRLQIVWTKSDEEDKTWGPEFVATYEMVLYEGEEALGDIRANDEEGRPSEGQVKVEMGQTKCSGGGGKPYENHDGSLNTPFRDGVHMMRDSIRLGNLPMYVMYGNRVQTHEQELVEHEGRMINKSLLEKETA